MKDRFRGSQTCQFIASCPLPDCLTVSAVRVNLSQHSLLCPQAMLRRLEKRIYVPLPNLEARQCMLTRFLGDRMAEAQSLAAAAERTEGFSGSDISSLCKEAAMRWARLPGSAPSSTNAPGCRLTATLAWGSAGRSDVQWPA